MKRLFRILLWFFCGFIVLFLLGQFFLMIRQSESGKQLVHRDSEAIVRVNIDKVLLDLAKNAVLNPRTYFVDERDTIDRGERISFRNAGLSLPANVYFFAMPADSTVFYTILKLKDKERFHRYVLQFMDKEVEPIGGDLWYIGDEEEKVCFLGNAHHVVVSVRTGKEDIKSKMQEVLLSDNLVAVRSLDIHPVSTSTSELIYYNLVSKNSWQLDFSIGKVALSGYLASSDWILSDTPQARTMDPNNLLSTWLYADIRPWLLHQRAFFEQYHVDIDSLQPFLGNYWELQWKPGIILQKDTVITYDYDDNFDMIEKESIRDTPVPDLRFSIKASPHLTAYLPDKLFYRFGKNVDNGLIQLSTDLDALPEMELHPASQNLYLRYYPTANANILTERFPWLHVIREAELDGYRDGSNSMRLSGVFSFEKKHIHPLQQLFGNKM